METWLSLAIGRLQLIESTAPERPNCGAKDIKFNVKLKSSHFDQHCKFE
ncbi:hypothetical protein JCM19239_2980 [Vibrio variabilis]|uniref:Uncharacterized protein n=1 Tax=Vibrio variabilis TaxID=990271 RepID=A0ABQ0J5E1_9VIBR|nr:hypothetical protein JCM19239_2980 [Vibrio variabilis]